jgi:hypothetical protein
MERLTNLTKRVIAVPKEEVEREERKWQAARKKDGTSTKRSGSQ